MRSRGGRRLGILDERGVQRLRARGEELAEIGVVFEHEHGAARTRALLVGRSRGFAGDLGGNVRLDVEVAHGVDFVGECG